MSAFAKPKTNGRPRVAPAPAIAPVPLEHEDLVVHRGRRSGLYMAVAIHSTVLGPALGGVRLWHYGEPIEAVRDAMRLARGMTYKAAVAGLELGGGKGVVCAPATPPSRSDRRALLLDFGDLVESLGGRYVTAEDVGVTPADLAVIAERTDHVTGLATDRGGSGDPSPFTALGVEAAMRACARGHVGAKLARRLADRGAEVVASDVDPGKRPIAESIGARWVEPDREITVACDVLAPCALGGAIDAELVPDLRCAVVCGCANNQLADESLADDLDERGILYAPDYVVNAGGLIHVDREIHGRTEAEAVELVLGIEGALDSVFAIARADGMTPLAAARRLAEERLDAAVVRD
jgi:leucine dehydrogenase